jgi:hypothetical protein
VARFWAVADPFLEAVAAGAVPPELVQETTRRLDEEYLEAGTAVLRRFASQEGITARSLTAAMAADPFRYRAVRAASMSLVEDRGRVEARVHALNRRLHELYPEAAFRDLYFVVGAAGSGGTAFSGGMVVATELAATVDDYMNLVAHELAHAQQPSRSNASVLRHGLREGAADWVAEQLTGQPIRSRAFAWGYAHEEEIWADFRRYAGSTLFGRWFGDARSPVVPGRLGYFMGYRIISDYAETQRAQGRSEAEVMTEVLRFGRPEHIVRESGYRPGPISRIRSGSLRAMGLRPHGEGAELPALGVRAGARIEAPDGTELRNEVLSSANGSGRLHRSDGYRAAAERRFTWAVNPDGVDAADDLTRGLVRGEELHALALFPETRLFEPVYLGEVAASHRRGADTVPSSADSTAAYLAVRWKVNATDSLVLYYHRADTLPAGVDILWTDPAVRVRFTDWAPVRPVEGGAHRSPTPASARSPMPASDHSAMPASDQSPTPASAWTPVPSQGSPATGARLFRGATVRRGDQVLRYTWDQLELGPVNAREFVRPRYARRPGEHVAPEGTSAPTPRR